MDKELTIDDIIEMYNEKYEDSFSYVGGGGAVWTADYYDVTLHSEKLDADVVVYFYEDGRVTDNYMAIFYKEDVEGLVQPIAEAVYGNCIVVNEPIHYGEDHFTESMDLRSYVSTKKSSVSVSIATDRNFDSRDEDMTLFISGLKKADIATDVCVYYYEPEAYSQVHKRVQTDDFLSSPFSPETTKQLDVNIDSDYAITCSDWSE